jgi:hypothetical protein
MTKRTTYWLWATILVILLIAIYTVKIIFWPQYKLTGRVVDKQSNNPIANAVVYIPNSENYALTDNSGNFDLSSENPGKHLINIEARGFYGKSCESIINRIATSTDIGTVYLESAMRVGWPIPDEMANRFTFSKYLAPPEAKHRIQRTTRLLLKLPELPVKLSNIPQFPSLKDTSGGEWYLFYYLESPYMLTYIRPDGSIERYIPTPLKQGGYRSLEIKFNCLYLRGVLGKSAENQIGYIDSFSVADFQTDTDNDSLLDRFETFFGLNPYNPDTDNDGLFDIDDPLPTVPCAQINNDTTTLLQSAFNISRFPLYVSSPLIAIIEQRLKAEDRRWFSDTFYKHELPVETFNPQLNSFEPILARLNSTELRRLVSILKNNFDDIERKRLFSYYHLLSGLNVKNIDSVKTAILDGFYRTLIVPVYMRGDIINFAVHPENSTEMILPLDPYEFRENILERLYIGEKFELVKMNDSEALVHYFTKTIKYEIICVKRDNEWRKIFQLPLFKN